LPAQPPTALDLPLAQVSPTRSQCWLSLPRLGAGARTALTSFRPVRVKRGRLLRASLKKATCTSPGASDMYVSAGSNVYPREIEEKLLAHPAFAEAAIVGVPDSTWDGIGLARQAEFSRGSIASMRSSARSQMWVIASGYQGGAGPNALPGIVRRSARKAGAQSERDVGTVCGELVDRSAEPNIELRRRIRYPDSELVRARRGLRGRVALGRCCGTNKRIRW
jgi:hypothetical protein